MWPDYGTVARVAQKISTSESEGGKKKVFFLENWDKKESTRDRFLKGASYSAADFVISMQKSKFLVERTMEQYTKKFQKRFEELWFFFLSGPRDVSQNGWLVKCCLWGRS